MKTHVLDGNQLFLTLRIWRIFFFLIQNNVGIRKFVGCKIRQILGAVDEIDEGSALWFVGVTFASPAFNFVGGTFASLFFMSGIISAIFMAPLKKKVSSFAHLGPKGPQKITKSTS